MIHVASLGDRRLSEYRYIADHRWLRAAGLFVAEGRLVVRRLLAAGRFTVRSVLVTPAAFEALRDVLAETTTDVFVIDQDVMNDLAGFNIHRGCLALAERPPRRRLSDVDVGALERVVVLENVNNPDNVGGIFRSAAAFGFDLVVLGPSCSDPLYRKSVRTSMAATLAMPFVDAGDWPAALSRLRDGGVAVLALTPAADATLLGNVARDRQRVAILVGAEGAGLSAAALQAAHLRVRIPMAATADSLNVMVAASIAMYHVSRMAADGA